MRFFLALAAIAGVAGLAGCATPGAEPGAGAAAAASASPSAPAAASGKAAVGPAEKTYITGSRIPDRPPRDRMLKRIEGDDYRKDQNTTVITAPTRPGN